MNIHIEIDKDAAAEMWSDGLSITEIAARYGVTRSKISGMMARDRERFPKRRADGPRYARTGGKKPQPKEHGERRAKPTHDNVGNKVRNLHKIRMEAVRREAAGFEAGTSELLKIAPMDELRLATGKELVDLAPRDCRWPLNNGSPFIFCAAVQFQGSVYCAHHMLRSMPKQAVES